MRPSCIILVDQDGVFADFAGAYFALARETDHVLYTHLMAGGEQVNYYCHDHITDPVLHARGEQLSNHPELFSLIKPYAGAIDGMHRLRMVATARGVDVMICTAPHTTNLNSYSAKARWILEYLGKEWLDKTLMVRDKTVINGSILIDDKPKPLGNFKPSWKHVVMPHAYNREQQKTNFVFGGWDTNSLNELVDYAQQ